MKKYILFITLFCLTFNVKAYTSRCTYVINENKYTLEYEYNYSWPWSWTNLYNLNDKLFDVESGETSNAFKIINPNINLFQKLKLSGNVEDGVCPVLVALGSNNYTVMPFDTYKNYFYLEYSENEDKMTLKRLNESSNNKPFTLQSICDYYNNPIIHDYQYVPMLEYAKENTNYEIVRLCRNYSDSGMPVGKKLIDYFSTYETDFIIGESDEGKDICPLNNGKNTINDIIECLTEKGDAVDDAIEEFINACTENEMLAIQSYGSGTLTSFYEKGGISPYLNNEIKLLFKSFSSECGEAADKLNGLVRNLGSSIYSYYDDQEINNKISYLYAESKYLSGYNMLTSPNQYVKISEDVCQLISSDLRNVILEILNALKIGGVVIVIFLSIIDVYKEFVSHEAKGKILSSILKRLIILILLLLLPTIIDILLDCLNKFIPVETSSCIVNELS